MKVLTAFPISDAKRGYRRHECHRCYKERLKGYYWQDREAKKAKSRDHWRDHGRPAYTAVRDWIFQELGDCCQCCGEMNPIFLGIDHVENNGADWRRQYGAGLRALKRIKKEIEAGGGRYQILCHNCNIGKKINGGICPHKEGSTTIPNGSRAK